MAEKKKSGDIDTDAMFDIPTVRKKPAGKKIRDPFREARRFHGWTLDKLEILRLYLQMYRRVAGNGTYIDTCAGDGTALIHGRIAPGSVPVAMSMGSFKQLHLFETPDVMDQLEYFLGYTYPIRMRRKVRTHVGDVNVELPKVLESGAIPKDKTCFAFVDPNSTQVDWATVAALAAYKDFVPGTKLCKVEQWVLVNTGHALQRDWPPDRTSMPPAHACRTLDRVMGGRAAWKDLYLDGEPATKLAYRYAERMREVLGYEYAIPHAIRKDRSNSRIQYFMVHATDHSAAIDFMNWAQNTPTEEIAREVRMFD